MSIRDEMVRCPFDEHHLVSRARFPVHLIKCRKQHKNKNFSICPYNATHYILTPEFQFHLENCPDRKERELAAALAEEEDRPSHVDNIVVPPPSEIWGNDEEEVVSYLDVKDQLIAQLPILRAPTGLTKSERKKFMRREIHRFHNLGKDKPSTSKGSDNDSGSEKEEGQGGGIEEEREQEEQKQDRGDDQAAGDGARGGYAEEVDEEEGAVGGKEEHDVEFSVVKKKKKKKKRSDGVNKAVEDKGGRSSSDKKKSHGRRH